jgi:flavin reductase (DIM6/NTAB) family NADH-FMN oxidoreductase RutF
MKVLDISYDKMLSEALAQLPKGAFLTVKGKDEINTMTIGWGTIGVIWGKPIFTVGVRPSRYTFDLIEHSKDFTVSIPINQDLKKQLGFCGSKSKRDVDKFKECNLTVVEGKNVNSPIIGECKLHYECKIVGKQELLPEQVISTIKDSYYSNDDYHTMYYGEIVSCYIIED